MARKSEVLSTGHTHEHAARDAQAKVERLAAALEDVLNGGDDVSITTSRRTRTRYEMYHWEPGMIDTATSEIFIVISPAFLECLPDYDIPPLARDIMLKLIGRLRERDETGTFKYFATDGEIRGVTQVTLANLHRVARPSVGRAISALTQRGFVWSTGVGKLQIHPHIAYFGPAEIQAEAIVRIASKRPEKALPRILAPGALIGVKEKKNGETELIRA